MLPRPVGPISVRASAGTLVRFHLQSGPPGRSCTRTPTFEASSAFSYLTGGKWCARPELHGHCSALGLRPTVCCRRAHGPRSRTPTCVVLFRREVPGCG